MKYEDFYEKCKKLTTVSENRVADLGDTTDVEVMVEAVAGDGRLSGKATLLAHEAGQAMRLQMDTRSFYVPKVCRVRTHQGRVELRSPAVTFILRKVRNVGE